MAAVKSCLVSAHIPKLRVNKGSSRYFVVLGGKRCYLGKWTGAKKPPMEILAAYHDAIRCLVDPKATPWEAPIQVTADLTVIEGCLAFIADQRTHHGKQAEETAEFALRPVVQMFGRTPAKDFGPLRLRAVRDHLVKLGRSRSGINNQINRVKRAWRWLASLEMVPAAPVDGHRCLRALRYGQTEAPESKPKPTVSVDMAEATASKACYIIAAMVRVQVLTGLRAGEVCAMTSGQIDRSDPACWFFRPNHHKNKWRGKVRSVPIGPRCQLVLLPFLRDDAPDAALFSPKAAVADVRARLHAGAHSPSRYCRAKGSPERVAGDFYGVHEYRRAIARVNAANGLPPWSPSCLRATRAQSIFEAVGLDGARTLLGHADESTTLKYYVHEAEEKSKALALIVG